MTIVFAASEVGSARALLPICDVFYANKYPFKIINRGYISENVDDRWGAFITSPESDLSIKRMLSQNQTSAVVFSSNVSDAVPLRIARGCIIS